MRVHERSALAAQSGEAPDLMSASFTLGLGTPAPETKRVDKPHTPTADKILLAVEDALSLTTLSRAVVMDAMKNGQLPTRKFGRAWKVKRRDLDAWIDNL